MDRSGRGVYSRDLMWFCRVGICRLGIWMGSRGNGYVIFRVLGIISLLLVGLKMVI